MKSRIIQEANYIPAAEKKLYSDLRVLQSNAGYYIGTIFDDGMDWQEPGSRDSWYFSTEKDAEMVLADAEELWKTKGEWILFTEEDVS